MGATLVVATRLLLAVQSTAASLTGVVRDGQTGEPVAGALVRLTDLSRAYVTDRTGRYAFPFVPSGPQHLDVRRIGYHPRAVHVLLPAHGVLELDVTMRSLPQMLETVDVRPPPRVLLSVGRPEAEQVAPERTLSSTAIQHHPLLAEPDAFLALGSGSIALAPESPSGVHVLGGSADQIAFLVNGIPVFSPYHAAGAFSAWNPDALERIRFSVPATAAGSPDALSGSLSADTRAPQSVLQAQGGLTTTHARITVDGPVGETGTGFLLSLRAGFPGAVAPPGEPSYIKGETSDVLATIEHPALGGRARVLAYDSGNEFITAAVTGAVDPIPPNAPRNEFHWHSRSIGADWRGAWHGSSVTARVWSAASDDASQWHGADSGVAVPIRLAASRKDAGAFVQFGGDQPTGPQGAAWLRSSRTRYVVRQADGRAMLQLDGRTPVAALDLSHGIRLSDRTWARAGLVTYHGADRLWLAPRLIARSEISHAITLGASLSRGLQFTQSLRNPESVVATIFPPDLDVGAGIPGVPVARSLDVMASAEFRTSEGVEVRGVVWSRRLSGLLLTAPVTGDPFAVETFTGGSGTATGAAIDASVSGTRYAGVASYAWQRVSRSTSNMSYAPAHGSRHLADMGIVVFPTPTLSARASATIAAGRRGTTMLGGLEWESCNLLDRGCEFGGSPRHDPAGVGAAVLPPYVRFDVGLRKHWHPRIAGRDAQLALHGTLTNLLSRANILTLIRPRSDAPDQPLQMRPFAPLVVGLDWRF